MKERRQGSDVLAYSTGLKAYRVGRLLHKLEVEVCLLDNALESHLQGQLSSFQQWLKMVSLLKMGQDGSQQLDLSIAATLIYGLDSPNSLLRTVYQAKELSAGVFPLEATEKLNALYHQLAGNAPQASNSAAMMRQDLSGIAQTINWLNGILWKEWDLRDSVKPD